MGFEDEDEAVGRYGTCFPGELMAAARGLHAGDWELYWALCRVATAGNWVRLSGPEMAAAFGLSRTALFKRLRKLKERGLILGTRKGYLLNGKAFFRGRLFSLRTHLDEYRELAGAEGCQPDEGEESPSAEADEAWGEALPSA